MAKCDVLRDSFALQTANSIELTFYEICQIVQIPNFARDYSAWWANEDPETTTHVQCRGWMVAGYQAIPNLQAKVVRFTRLSG